MSPNSISKGLRNAKYEKLVSTKKLDFLKIQSAPKSFHLNDVRSFLNHLPLLEKQRAVLLPFFALGGGTFNEFGCWQTACFHAQIGPSYLI
jgi:hypothetical protein